MSGDGRERDRSQSEVGDTLRYFNSMTGSRSWCCSEYDVCDYGVIDLHKLSMPLAGAATATAAAKAVAVAAAVGCDPSNIANECDEHIEENDHNSSNECGIIYMKEKRQEDINRASPYLLSPPSHVASLTDSYAHHITKKSVSILLTTPSESSEDYCHQKIGDEINLMPSPVVDTQVTVPEANSLKLSDPLLNKGGGLPNKSVLKPTLVPVYRRASDEYPFYLSPAPARPQQLLDVVNIIDNPFLSTREASDGVNALREDREKQRRHSSSPGHQCEGTSTKTIREWLSCSFNTLGVDGRKPFEEPSSSNNVEDKRKRPRVEVPEVIVSDHTSPVTETYGVLDVRLERVHRDLMARTVQKYLVIDATPLKDRLFTGGLILLTMVGILMLFWYQNFGPGFPTRNVISM